LRVQTRIELARLHDSLQTTMIYVTHDQIEAMTLADKIVVLQNGKVEQVGAPMELYHQPRNLFVAGFMGSPKMNFLPVTVVAVNGSETTVKLPSNSTVNVLVQVGQLAVGETATLGIRPEHLQIAQTKSALNGEVVVVEQLGGETYLYVQMAGGDSWVVRTDGANRSRLHDRVSIHIEGSFCHLFNAQGEAVSKNQHHSLTYS
jgi:multiple sugar transport system ATP-binding protein